MTRTEFRALASRRFLQLDGATGTELARRGMPAGVCPEEWVLSHPGALAEVQQSYVAAGADIVYAPTFGANPLKLAEFGLEEKTIEMNRALAALSRRAVPGTMVFGDIAPTGQLIEPFGPLAFERAVELYKIQIRALIEGGVDGFALETMMDLQEARAALIAVRELSELPTLVTLTFEPGGRSLTGTHPVSALVTLQALGADAFGCNCSTGPEAMAEIIRELKVYARIPLVAKPNAGMPHLVDGNTVFDLDPAQFADAAESLLAAGANIVGGCCGTTPAHLAALHEKIRTRNTPVPVKPTRTGVIASPGQFRRLAPEEPFAIIGERINPTGKKALQAELRNGSLEMVKTFAREQTEQGAALLDVNFGLSGIDETDMMRRGIAEIMQCCNTPLCIDSTRPEAVEAALRLYPGRALFNSISAEENRLRGILPIAAKYGAMLVLLPLTDAGIPETLEERLAVLEKIMREAAGYGYTPEEFAADALIMTISANPEAAKLSLDFIEACSRKMHLNTVCGLSNVSFGLPNRPAANLAFLGMALGRGLNIAIANPSAPGVVDMTIASDALAGKDPRLENYLARFAGNTVSPAAAAAQSPAAQGTEPPSLETSMYEAVLRGRRETALELLDKLLAAGSDPGGIVNEILIPAITEVGERFERKEYFLPQLMQSASAMQKAMEKLEPLLRKSGTDEAAGPVVVFATVKGDIHDIGKNIVILLLKNHNFRVIDLGKDVPAETIVAAAMEHHAALIGLSALMTTTMPQMKVVIDLARARGLEIPVVVGGAAVDEAFAKSIGAYYGSDAMATVRIAQKITRENAPVLP